MKIFSTILVLAVISLAGIIPCYWTGQSRQFVTAMGNPAISCEYKAPQGQTFWKSFQGSVCAQSVEGY